jgi:hypothetical protein
MCVDLDDTDTIQNGRTPWFPLETVLEAWVDMIEHGKIVATTEADDVEKPWMLAPYSPKILQDTVDLFNALVREIESRLPRGSTGTGHDSSPFIEKAILDTSNPQRGFAYHFAQKAKRPHFRYIAPGLEIPTSSDDTAQPFASFDLMPKISRHYLSCSFAQLTTWRHVWHQHPEMSVRLATLSMELTSTPQVCTCHARVHRTRIALRMKVYWYCRSALVQGATPGKATVRALGRTQVLRMIAWNRVTPFQMCTSRAISPLLRAIKCGCSVYSRIGLVWFRGVTGRSMRMELWAASMSGRKQTRKSYGRSM